jgi:hypothetical protein
MKLIKIVTSAALVGCLATASFGAGFLFGPKGDFSTSIGGRLEYDPSDACSKPSKPYTNDSFSRDMYFSSAKIYISCLESTANDDVEYAQKVIIEGHKKAAEDFLNEIRREY